MEVLVGIIWVFKVWAIESSEYKTKQRKELKNCSFKLLKSEASRIIHQLSPEEVVKRYLAIFQQPKKPLAKVDCGNNSGNK